MNVLGGNLLRSRMISYELQFKLLLFRPKTPILSSSTNHPHRHFSAPVRYIPQNPISPNTQDLQNTPTLGNHKVPRKTKYTLVSESGYKIKSSDSKKVKEVNSNEEEAMKVALQALGKKGLTVTEVQTKLRAKGFTSNVIEKVVGDFKSKGYLNDYLYAESFTRSKWSSLTWGPNRIKQALRRKGVSKEDIDNANKYVFESVAGGDGNETCVGGMSKLSMDHLFLQASKQWLRTQDLPLVKRKTKITWWLEYRGFNWGVISFITKKLESEYPSP